MYARVAFVIAYPEIDSVGRSTLHTITISVALLSGEKPSVPNAREHQETSLGTFFRNGSNSVDDVPVVKKSLV